MPPVVATTPATTPPRPPMEFRKLGRTGLDVSVIGFGSWVSFDYQVGVPAAKAIIAAAHAGGVNFFDNAEVYAHGRSEEIMGQALRELCIPRQDLVISTKVFFGDSPAPAPSARGLSRKHVIEGTKASLVRLQLDYVDIVFAHRPDPTTPIEETVRAFNWVIDQGLAFYWGTSEWPAAAIEEAHAVAARLGLVGPAAEQPQYSLLHRSRVEVEYDRLYEPYGTGLTTFSPLACGMLSGKYGGSSGAVPEDSRFGIERYKFLADRWLQPEKLAAAAALRPLAAELGATPAQLALAWCAANPRVSCVLTGASKVEQVEENLGALLLLPRLTPEVLARIEAAVGSSSSVELGKQPVSK